VATLRWSVRSDGNTGYVFVNNYERLRSLPERKNVQFKLNLPDGQLVFPREPVTIPADAFFFWPFNLDLDGAKLIYATTQPICKTEDGGAWTFFFVETPGVKAQFVFDAKTLASKKSEFKNLKPSREPAIELQTKSGHKIQVVLLNEADSLALKRTNDQVAFETPPKVSVTKIKTKLIQPAGSPREIPLSTGKSHIALAPTEADWTNAAVWEITLPKGLDLKLNPLLRIHYLGDVARVTLNGKLLDDNFYCGREFDLGLSRYVPEILTGDLRLEILPLPKDSPLFFEPKDRPDFEKMTSVARLQAAELVESLNQ
jgi:hypothetical protein